MTDRIVVVFTEDELAAVQEACRRFGMQWPEEKSAYEATKAGVWWDSAVERGAAILLARSGGHFEPIRDMSESKAREDVAAVFGGLSSTPTETSDDGAR